MSKTLLRAAIAGACVSALALGACQKAAPAKSESTADTAAIAASIKQMEAGWSAEMAQKDAAKWLAHYTPDATLIMPMSPVLRGMDAIKPAAAATFADPNFSLTFVSDNVKVAKSGEMAVSTGSFKATATDPATKKPGTLNGSYITVYEKQADGSWKVSYDLATVVPDMPAK